MKTAKGFLLAGTQSGVGKTTISTGIMGALKKRGYRVKPFKVGPDYIDPQFHRFITDNPSRNLDSYMLKEKTIKRIFTQNITEEDLAVVEGVMGLYDGYGTEKDQGSSAHVAKILDLPVVLVIDGSGTSTSGAAMVLGYKLYDAKVNIQGIIINNLSGERHYLLLKEAIERDTGIKCIGYLKKNKNIQLKSRHLGLIPCGEVPALQEKVDEVVAMIEETIDLEALVRLSGKIAVESYLEEGSKPLERKITIAFAYDDAFNFYYQDNLDLLKELGCHLISFSPLKDKELPEEIDGIYIGGGFPEVFAKELEENKSMRRDIYQKALEGVPIYGECGGFMYLTKGIKTFDGEYHEMAGIFDAASEMTNRLQRFGYCEVEIKESSSFFERPFKIKGHEFHRGIIKSNNNNSSYHVKKTRKGEIQDSWDCGLEKYNCLGAFPHIHFYSNPSFVKGFLERCQSYKLFRQRKR
ncbi:hydrogenobyrinic acid a,c-diamide synthase (glutamine-hydrolysing) /cobyrinate a,c-diamide synthase [Natronincola peptidivorans]|uniref:Cobyrinate a,c-diamide synthase n=1 Tax=Natronincola peptidivorans TaxID=426128 RepID=A0A1I0CWQ0_9FIRM|nr:cobyrinate a,c-diamide synthase [Natronincola peptidivorans]SET24280.1 hydrogenobyrinic acid a,c-diamide synthase (glutamine-hydrolysing) /cobyrinate a,c-diamide synthase [Natronincola peptidivorans]